MCPHLAGECQIRTPLSQGLVPSSPTHRYHQDCESDPVAGRSVPLRPFIVFPCTFEPHLLSPAAACGGTAPSTSKCGLQYSEPSPERRARPLILTVQMSQRTAGCAGSCWLGRGQYSTVLHGAPRYCTVLHGTARYSTVLHSAPRDSTVLHGTARYCTVLHGTPRYCTVLHGTARYCTVLHGTPRYSKVLHSTPCRKLLAGQGPSQSLGS